MRQFLLMTANGTTPPKYIWHSIEQAQNEAIRLCEQFGTSVKILEIVGIVIQKEVPVTERKTVVELIDRFKPDDLPF